VWDALTSTRPYRGKYSFTEAVGMMESGRGKQFDPIVLDALLSIVHLSHGHRAAE
jgi:HD-GYP domain-containing protein (c-di-GMP phosphodiesterase class II)